MNPPFCQRPGGGGVASFFASPKQRAFARLLTLVHDLPALAREAHPHPHDLHTIFDAARTILRADPASNEIARRA
jgi:hypothetical protein